MRLSWSNLNWIAFLTNKGNGEFNAPVNVTTATIPDLVLAADFNNDGKDDVAVTDTFGTIGILLNTFTSAQPCLSINDVSVTETDAGTVNAVFTVSLSEASSQTVRVNYFTTPVAVTFFGSDATKGVDFEHVADTLTFLPGETTKTIGVVVKGDLLDELDQFFNVILTTPINAAISDGKGLGTIVDNDLPPAITSATRPVEGTGFGVQNFATSLANTSTHQAKITSLLISHSRQGRPRQTSIILTSRTLLVSNQGLSQQLLPFR